MARRATSAATSQSSTLFTWNAVTTLIFKTGFGCSTRECVCAIHISPVGLQPPPPFLPMCRHRFYLRTYAYAHTHTHTHTRTHTDTRFPCLDTSLCLRQHANEITALADEIVSKLKNDPKVELSDKLNGEALDDFKKNPHIARAAKQLGYTIEASVDGAPPPSPPDVVSSHPPSWLSA